MPALVPDVQEETVPGRVDREFHTITAPLGRDPRGLEAAEH
jgi:hypothetical protein